MREIALASLLALVGVACKSDTKQPAQGEKAVATPAAAAQKTGKPPEQCAALLAKVDACKGEEGFLAAISAADMGFKLNAEDVTAEAKDSERACKAFLDRDAPNGGAPLYKQEVLDALASAATAGCGPLREALVKHGGFPFSEGT